MPTTLSIALLAIAILGATLFLHIRNDPAAVPDTAKHFTSYGLATDTTVASINSNDIFPSGVDKESIPALTEPVFVPLEAANLRDTDRGIFVQRGSVSRFYPYNILVWHEVVNDVVDDTPLAVTYCPRSDTSIVFSRLVRGDLLQFASSSLFFESNHLLYDTKTASLWLQARQKAVVGSYTETELTLLPSHVLQFSEVREKYPDTMVLSTDTGHNRNYSSTSYATYRETEQTAFPISVTDKRFPAKEVFYIIPFENRSLSLRFHEFPEGKQPFTVDARTITITRDGDEMIAKNGKEHLPGYFSSWFSWSVHHQDSGLVLWE